MSQRDKLKSEKIRVTNPELFLRRRARGAKVSEIGCYKKSNLETKKTEINIRTRKKKNPEKDMHPFGDVWS